MFFNTKRQSNIKTHNLAGGEAFTETPKLELLSVLLTSTLKDEFYRKADATVNRVKQLVAEHLVTITTKRGFQKLEWQKVRERNEALDCRVYARAAVWIAGADRWSEDKWRDLEDQVGPLPEDSDDTHSNIEAGRLARPNPPSTKRQSDWLGPRGKWF